MGVVYRAVDSDIGRQVAVKVIRFSDLSDTEEQEQLRGRLFREARAAGILKHPGIVTIYYVGEEREVAFIAMEYVNGPTLEKLLLADVPLAKERIRQILREAAAALDYAHRKGIVHRDIKPANIMLEENETVKICDFGIAKGFTGLSSITQAGMVMGTPQYMPPEQIQGNAVDARADQYSLAVIAFQALTGRRPFEADSIQTLFYRILTEPPEAAHKLNPTLPPAVAGAFGKALAKEPANRYATCGEFVAELLKACDTHPDWRPAPHKGLAGSDPSPTRSAQLAPPAVAPEPPPAPSPPAAEPAVAPSAPAARKRQTLRVASIAGVAAILCILALAYLLHVTHKPRPDGLTTGLSTRPIKVRRSVAVLGFKNLAGRPDAAWLSTALSEMFATELGAGEELRVISGESVARTKTDLSLPDSESFAQDTLVKIRKNLGSDVVVIGSYIDLGKESGGQMRLDLRVQDTVAGEALPAVSVSGTEKELFALVSKAGATLRKELGVGPLSASEASAVQGSLPGNPGAAQLYSEGLIKLRLFDALAARDLLDKAVASEPQYAPAYSALADAWSLLGYTVKAQEEAKRAFELSGDFPREQRLLIEGRYRELSHEWDKAVEVYRTLFGSFPDNLDYGLRLAGVETSASQVNEALKTLDALRRLPSPARDDPRIDLEEDRAAESLGDHQRQQAAAVRAADKARAQGAKLLVATALDDEAWALLSLGELKQAAAAAKQSKEIYEAAGDEFGASHALGDGATVLFTQGDVAGAMGVYQESLRIARRIGNKHGEAAWLHQLANCSYRQGNLDEAKKLYEQAAQGWREVGDKRYSAATMANIANVLQDEGDLAGAAGMFRQSLALSHEIGDKHAVGNAMDNLGNVLAEQGDLAGAERAYQDARELYSETGDKSGAAYVISGLGEVFKKEGDLTKARRQQTEALSLRRAMGEQVTVAESLTALAGISIEEGHPADAQGPLRDALEILRQQQLRDDELDAHVVLARALLSLGRRAEAEKEIDLATHLAAKSQNHAAHLAVSIEAARIRAASGRPSDLADAAKTLNIVLAEATKCGFAGYQFEARLSLGEMELKSGQAAAGRARLQALEKDATATRCLLIARKAAAALGQKPQTW
jgi:tetratricopeptide (TPR) repeat protein/predicted Ser/Thr protein kinase